MFLLIKKNLIFFNQWGEREKCFNDFVFAPEKNKQHFGD